MISASSSAPNFLSSDDGQYHVHLADFVLMASHISFHSYSLSCLCHRSTRGLCSIRLLLHLIIENGLLIPSCHPPTDITFSTLLLMAQSSSLPLFRSTSLLSRAYSSLLPSDMFSPLHFILVSVSTGKRNLSLMHMNDADAPIISATFAFIHLYLFVTFSICRWSRLVYSPISR